ncbi:MAG: hypothetical protein M3Q22_02995 [Actinomycetota bacterium]|nr:hypothetical protein [Actinomycetota bacterium]MDP9459245.1 hypothetical protein [Actinomycetota bacterium]
MSATDVRDLTTVWRAWDDQRILLYVTRAPYPAVATPADCAPFVAAWTREDCADETTAWLRARRAVATEEPVFNLIRPDGGYWDHAGSYMEYRRIRAAHKERTGAA